MTSKVTANASATRIVAALLLATYARIACAQGVQKKAAMDWAVEQRAAVFDALMGIPTRDTVDTNTVSFAIRSPGFEDTFEFGITIVQTGAKVRGTVTIPEREPITVQLARLREHGAVSLDECIKQVRVIRRPLPQIIARRIAGRLASLCVPIVPAQKDIVLDRRRFEVASAAWSDMRMTIVDDPHAKGVALRLLSSIRQALVDAGIDISALNFDPQGFYQ